MSVSPFNWLEASYFYYRPTDLAWEVNNVRGHFLDKGFNVKFLYKPKYESLPSLAIGLDDFAGTGLFTREYIVTTKKFDTFKVSAGIGWGKYAGKNSFKNPLSTFKDSLRIRPDTSDNFNQGGSLSYDQWFRGNSAFFGGFEFKNPNIPKLNIKLEYDPFNYFDFSALNRSDADLILRKKDSNINFGLNYSINDNFDIELSYIKGNTLNFTITYGIAFGNDNKTKPKFSPRIVNTNESNSTKSQFYLSLLKNLNENRLLLQTANIDSKGNLDISISTSDHRNAVRSSSYAAYIANKIGNLNEIDLSKISISHINVGVEVNKISYIANHLDEDNNIPIELIIRNSSFSPGDINKFLNHEFRPTVNFPVIFSSTSPAIVSHIGNPEKFYFGGINLQNTTEIQFSRNLILTSEINYRIYDNFQDTVAGPGSKMTHVRTDLVDYLKEDDLGISRLQLDYIWSPYKEIYSKLSAGFFEQMYGGIGGEILYKPFNKNYTIGAELFAVKQRAFDQKFNFKKYQTVTGHINFGYKFAAGIEANISYGRYLAKDDGFTIDLGRRTASGFKSGIYFTLTDVPKELFGEGSFDKGFYFQIPLDLLSNEYKGNYSSVKISPLTRDGGAKLVHDKDLRGLIYNSSYNELVKQWNGFLN